VEGRIYAKALLRTDGKLMLRNPPFLVRQKYDFKLLW